MTEDVSGRTLRLVTPEVVARSKATEPEALDPASSEAPLSPRRRSSGASLDEAIFSSLRKKRT